jgi:hypothetical protein
MDFATIPVQLKALLDSRGISATQCLRPDGRVSVRYEGGRLDFMPLTSGRLVIEGTLVELPMDAGARRTMLDRALRHSVALLKRDHHVLSHDRLQGTLILQCDVGAVENRFEFEEAVERMLDAIDRWRSVLRQPYLS